MPNQQPQPTEPLIDAVPETPFYIPAIGTPSRPRRSLKHGDCFAVLDSFGDVGASSGGFRSHCHSLLISTMLTLTFCLMSRRHGRSSVAEARP